MSKRKPGEDELSLWKKVARSAEPMHSDFEVHLRSDLSTKGAQINKAKEDAPQAISPFKVGSTSKSKKTNRLAPAITDQVASAPVNMDFKTYKQMRKGKLKPEARIDLHGMTTHRARPALTGFILSAQSQGRRLVLVITGKGRVSQDDGPIPTRIGVLRHEVPHWLSLPPLSSCVQQVTPANQKHGGTGAYYVYLRRR